MRPQKPFPLPVVPATRAVLVALGATDAMIRTQVGAGSLVAVRHGVYLAASAWPQDPGGQHLMRAYAETLAVPSAVLSHQTAAVAWGLPSPEPREWYELRPAVTVPSAGHGMRGGDVARHRASLPPVDVTRDAGGYLVTSPARTAVDLADGLALPQALVVLDAAARLIVESSVTSVRRSDYASARRAELGRELCRQASAHRASARLGRAIDSLDPRRESPAESLSAGYMIEARLPIPELQAPIRTPSGVVFVDFLWRDRRLVGECDGAVKYADSRGYVAEKYREQDLRDLGYGIVRWQGAEAMFRPSVVIDRISRALGL